MTRLTRSSPPTSTRLLLRILERPELVAVVDKLSPPVLARLIEHVGLEDAGELVAAASSPQLQRVWDRDLWWRPEHGSEERFDASRFALWLAVLLEAGEAHTVRRLREMPFDLLTLAVHRLIRVVDREQWLEAAAEAGDDDETDVGRFAPWHELVLVARDEGAWDSVLTALLALDGEDHASLRRVLDRCGDLDAKREAERDELHERLLPEDLALESDVAAERDARHAQTGFMASADARAFLRLSRTPPPRDLATLPRDPVTRAYFRELAPESERHASSRAAQAAAAAALTAGEGDGSALSSLLELLADSGVVSGGGMQDARAPAAALTAGGSIAAETARDPEAGDDRNAALTVLHAALHTLESDAPELWSERMEELGYLANVVLAGCTSGARPFSPQSALEAAAAVTSLGLELQLRVRSQYAARAVELLRSVSADRLFRAGYAVLYADLVRPARAALRERCSAYAPAAFQVAVEELLRDDDLGELPEGLDAELLQLSAPLWDALRGLGESLPLLAGTLAAEGVRFVTTRDQLRAAQDLLRAYDDDSLVFDSPS
jgi:hypothetical protein